MKTNVDNTCVQLLHESFSAQEALTLITQLIHQKIMFHEHKMKVSADETEVHAHEKRILELQRDLFQAREYIERKKTRVTLQGTIKFA